MPLEAVYDGGSVRLGLNGRQLDVRVPKGVRPGQVIRLAGQGDGGGDLLLEIEYAAHPQFEVDGRNIIHVLPVAPWEAALGATVSVPTLGGPVDLKIPADSEAGRKLRLRGRGLAGHARGRPDRGAGDHRADGRQRAAAHASTGMLAVRLRGKRKRRVGPVVFMMRRPACLAQAAVDGGISMVLKMRSMTSASSSSENGLVR